MPIGAYYCCYDQPHAAYYSLKAFREAYPNETIVLVNDAGDQVHEKLASKFGVTHYIYDKVNIGFPGRCDSVDKIIAWIKRLVDHLDKIKEEWFILLEDDVAVVRAIREEQLVHDINGICHTAVLPVSATNKLLERTGYGNNVKGNTNHQGRVAYGGMGGAIFRTAFFRRWKDKWEDVVRDLKEFEALCPMEPSGQTWYFSDTCLSYLTYLYGGTIGKYDDFTELWWEGAQTKMQMKAVAVVNQFKVHYGKPFDMSLLE